MKFTIGEKLVKFIFVLAVAFTFFCPRGMAQESATARPAGEDSIPAADPALIGPVEPASNPTSRTFFERHMKVLSMDMIGRYIYSDQVVRLITDRELQYKVSTGLQFNLDSDGATYLATRTETGNAFDGSWNNSGAGFGMTQRYFNVKSFYLGQKFGRLLEIQVGGIEFDPGVGSQATYAAGEAWLTGYRASIAPPKSKWIPDTLSFTAGRIGEFSTPSVFSRFHRMGDVNYGQIMGRKKLGDREEVSLEANSIDSVTFVRGAVHINQPIPLFLDDLLVESIGRVSDGSKGAWSFTGGKNFDRAKKYRAELIYNDLPPQVFNTFTAPLMLTWGEFSVGRKVGVGLHYHVIRDFELSFLGSRRINNTLNTSRWRGFVAASYDLAPLARLAMQQIK